ncbi:MAG: TIM barrel protein [bacterium]|nr:TIM barrel protein [bacterium]
MSATETSPEPKVRTFPALEGAQHGPKGLHGFLQFLSKVKDKHNIPVIGGQPSNFMLELPKSEQTRRKIFRPAKEITHEFWDANVRLVGVSAHCPFWVLLTAWTESPTIRPFISANVAKMAPDKIFKWVEEYLMRLLDLCAELGVKIVPMFWGVAFGWELATGYPWGFWSGTDYDLLKEGEERFVKMTARIRAHACALGIFLGHEIHPGTAAMCAKDFNRLVKICDGDPCVVSNNDGSHCWEGEDNLTRIVKVGDRTYATHIKNIRTKPGFPLRSMVPDFPNRAMQFTDLPSGEHNLVREVETLIHFGYVERYCRVMNTDMAPLVGEAESAFRDLDDTSANGLAYIQNELCWPLAAGSFEDGMGAEKK